MTSAGIAFAIIFVSYLEKILSFLIIIRVLLSWVPQMRPNFFTRIVFETTQPLLNAVYVVFPGLRRSMNDLSPIIVFLVISLVRDLIVAGLYRLI